MVFSELLRFVELELYPYEVKIPPSLKRLVNYCRGGRLRDYYAVDSGYVVQEVGDYDVLVQLVVGVGREVKKRFLVQKAYDDVHHVARINEIKFAEAFHGGLVLVDGPLTPYVSTANVVGVSKDPRLVRYGPRIAQEDLRREFVSVAKKIGEKEVARRLLQGEPPGSYLEPVEIGDFYGTFIKSDWVLYVEFPKSMRAEEICGVLSRYPIRLRVAHHLAKLNREFLDSIYYLMLNVVKPQKINIRELL